jgi:superkiller protein 3
MKTNAFFQKIIIFLTFFILISSAPNLKSGQQSVISGTVRNKEGKPLVNANVSFIDQQRGAKFSVKTNKKGKFIRVGIPPAIYNISVEYKGYFPFKTQFRISLGKQEKLTITLEKIPPKIGEDKDFINGINQFKQGHYREACELFEKAAQKFPENFEAFFNLGLSYFNSEKIDDAITSLEKAVKLKSDIAEVHFALGECYYHKENNKDKAIEAFSNVLKLQPNNAKAYYNLGITHYKYDEMEEAMNAFEKSMDLDPEYSSAYYQAGLASIKMGNIEKGVQYLEEFLRLNPDAPTNDQVKAIIQELKKRENFTNSIANLFSFNIFSNNFIPRADIHISFRS